MRIAGKAISFLMLAVIVLSLAAPAAVAQDPVEQLVQAATREARSGSRQKSQQLYERALALATKTNPEHPRMRMLLNYVGHNTF